MEGVFPSDLGAAMKNLTVKTATAKLAAIIRKNGWDVVKEIGIVEDRWETGILVGVEAGMDYNGASNRALSGKVSRAFDNKVIEVDGVEYKNDGSWFEVVEGHNYIITLRFR